MPTFVKERADHEGKCDCGDNIQQEKHEEDRGMCVVYDLSFIPKFDVEDEHVDDEDHS